MTGKQFRCRIARSSDTDEVVNLLKELADKIPLKVETKEHINGLRSLIERMCGNGKSLVASSDGHVIGFLLVRLEDYLGRQGLLIAYVGVTENWRGKGPFPALMARIKVQGLPLWAEVKHANKSHMATKLVDCFGFRKNGPSPSQGDYFVWDGHG